MSHAENYLQSVKAFAEALSDRQKIAVDTAALRSVLIALIGPSHLVLELQVTRRLPGNPIEKLIKEFNEQVAR